MKCGSQPSDVLDAVIGSLSSGLLSLFTLQLFSRFLTFGLNIVIARSVDKSSYGIGAVKLQLLYDTVLSLSREGFRDACQRTSPSAWKDSKERAQILSVAWLAIPLSLLVGAAVLFASNVLDASQRSEHESYHLIASMFVLAAAFEMLSEPLYILAQNLFLIKLRARTEMLALTVKVVLTAAMVMADPARPLRAFAAGQISYALSIFGCLFAFFAMSREGVGLSETVGVVSGSLFFSSFSQLDLQLAGLAATMCMKSLQKYLMEKGETLILLGLFESQTWAMYGIVQEVTDRTRKNLGSLAVRLVFLPLEEMAQLAFSKLLSSKDFDEALEVFSVLSQLVVFIGLLVASFGQGYSFASGVPSSGRLQLTAQQAGPHPLRSQMEQYGHARHPGVVQVEHVPCRSASEGAQE
ncbi:hypothetical protein GUITHDRAFT_147663 [Guillardia theta CCMP2712]|uniref:Protein RFT1 homolog n=1 Tax=Guillardia theta (strain CCMP2712) TaxID=905079 RepID=L1IC59_GUITC|nr:hypothetical protein GUITHDRAFT_147663 [Guillardia theta CCMP2712]EKX33821.1 hypothetical protein GUITHDRAFT_147663 [Guillardia theta CCMP2712]|eukprot:XP_005820801.1 hypothetical protein GUITHDRAFT_147663 [Guillardia theta CCMP2712]